MPVAHHPGSVRSMQLRPLPMFSLVNHRARKHPETPGRVPHEADRGRNVVPLLCVTSLVLAVLSLGVWAVPWQATAAVGAAGQPSFYGSGKLMAADPDGGYWLATSSGSVTSYKDAPALGSPAASG